MSESQCKVIVHTNKLTHRTGAQYRIEYIQKNMVIKIIRQMRLPWTIIDLQFEPLSHALFSNFQNRFWPRQSNYRPKICRWFFVFNFFCRPQLLLSHRLPHQWSHPPKGVNLTRGSYGGSRACQMSKIPFPMSHCRALAATFDYHRDKK